MLRDGALRGGAWFVARATNRWPLVRGASYKQVVPSSWRGGS